MDYKESYFELLETNKKAGEGTWLYIQEPGKSECKEMIFRFFTPQLFNGNK